MYRLLTIHFLLQLLFASLSFIGFLVVGEEFSSCRFSNIDQLEDGPWTARILIEYKNKTEHSTTLGAIINAETILTYNTRFIGHATYLRILDPSAYTVTIGPDSNLQNVNVAYVEPYPFFGRPASTANWFNAYDRIVMIHLAEKINFTQNIRPVCLLTNDKLKRRALKPGEMFYSTGLERYKTLGSFTFPFQQWPELLSFKIQQSNSNFCEQQLKERLKGQVINYENKTCGFISKPASGNRCAGQDSGLIVVLDNSAYLVGFVDNFFTYDTCGCDELGLVYSGILSKNVLSWVQAGMKCGSSSYACWDKNITCVPYSKICDKNPDCPDNSKSDEFPNICRAKNYCKESEKACGVYGKCLSESETEAGAECEPSLVSPIDPIVIIAAVTIISVVILMSLSLYWRKRINSMKPVPYLSEEELKLIRLEHSVLPPSNLPVENGETKVKFDATLIYKIKALTILYVIDHGHFGTVSLGLLRNESGIQTVALKEMKKSKNPTLDSRESFLSIMAEFRMLVYIESLGGHENIIKLLGVNLTKVKQNSIQIATEYCQEKNLKSYLEKLRTQNIMDFTFVHTLSWIALQIAQGMAFLAGFNIIHGDLAARNILLSSTLQVKISDFGLSHRYEDGYYREVTVEFNKPFQWMPLEIFLEGKYKPKTDVWSYGVVLWEIFTLGKTPWLDISPENYIHQLRDNIRLPTPEYDFPKINQLMLECWDLEEEKRPSFKEIVSLLNQRDLMLSASTSNAKYLHYKQIHFVE